MNRRQPGLVGVSGAASDASDASDASAEQPPLTVRLRRAYVAHALADRLPQRRSWLLKRALDVLLALPLLIVTAPLSFAVALYAWARFHRPATISRVRVTRGGRLFTVRQFHLSPRDASGSNDGEQQPDAWVSSARIARWPALWCVVTGDMSLVGPTPWTADDFATQPASALARLYVAPGVARLRPSGQLRRAATLAEAELFYVTRGSLWMDLQQLWAVAFFPRREFGSSGRAGDERDELV